jgi:drug/metabolite transporter (DMT)-like permease
VTSRIRLGPVLAALLAAMLFGASTPAAKLCLDGLGPLTLAGALYLGAAAVTLPFALRKPFRLRTRRSLLRLAGAVTLGGAVGPVLMLLALKHAGAASVSLWLSLETVFTAVLGWLFFHEHLGPRAATAAVLVTIGSVVLALPNGTAGGTAVLLVALACLCWALDNNWTAVIDELSPAQITFAKGFVAGSISFAVGWTIEPGFAVPSLAAGVGIGALGYGLSLVLYVSAAQQIGATRSQLLFSTAPIWGAGLAWTIALDPLGAAELGAAGLMALGLFLLGRERHEHAHVHPQLRHRHAHAHDDGHHDHEHTGVPTEKWHTHEHEHDEVAHAHPHAPDLHHRHRH